MISIPRGENRMFFNISDEVGRLLVMIVPETDQQIDPITYAPSLGKEIENEYGRRRSKACAPSDSSSRSRWAEQHEPYPLVRHARAQPSEGRRRYARL